LQNLNSDGFCRWYFALRIGGGGWDATVPEPAGHPLMIFSYIGALRAWIYTPIFALLGASTVSIGLNTLTTGEVRQSRISREMYAARQQIRLTRLPTLWRHDSLSVSA